MRDTCASKNSTNDDIHRLAGDSKDVGFVLNEMAAVFASHLQSDNTNEEEVEVSLSNVFCNKFFIDNIDVEKLLASVKAGKSLDLMGSIQCCGNVLQVYSLCL